MAESHDMDVRTQCRVIHPSSRMTVIQDPKPLHFCSIILKLTLCLLSFKILLCMSVTPLNTKFKLECL